MKKEFDKSKYDILLSETHAYLDSIWRPRKLHKAIVAEYTHRLCDRKILNSVGTKIKVLVETWKILLYFKRI